MTYARDKRLLLGATSLLVALPLPFNEVLEWPALAAFLLVVGLFVRRAWLGSERWLQARTLNLLGLAYLPFLIFDLGATGRIQPIRPILHLFLFGLAAKLWSLQRERDKWQAWIGIFFLFLAAMATSTHPAVVAYLLAFIALAAGLMLRFVHLHVLSSFGRRDARPSSLPVVRFVAALLLGTVVVAIPMFALLPRVRSPFVSAGGGLGGQQPGGASAGFSDEMSLDLIGRIRDNPAIALRVKFEGQYPKPESIRLKAATFETWQGRSWSASPRERRLRRESGVDVYVLRRGRAIGSARFFLEPIRTVTIPLPRDALELEIGSSIVHVDAGGAVALPGPPTGVLEYGVALGPELASLAPAFSADAESGALDASGVTPRIAELSKQWAPDGDASARARAIEARFHRDFLYTTAFIGRGGDEPIEWFLFEARRGHCEYFASAMVLMLRAQGIPARLVTGFYGAEWSPWENAWLVRQSNAHAWVEAWVGAEGWQIFDPTPPAGLPAAAPRSFGQTVLQAWDAILFRWDRWVISYDFDDQVGVIGNLRRYWGELMRDLFRRSEQAAQAPSKSPGAAEGVAGPNASETRSPRRALWWTGLATLVLAVLVAAVWVWRHRPAWTATLAYQRLRQTLRGAGLPILDSTAPLALARTAAERLPEAADPAARLVASYVDEAFAGRDPGGDAIAGWKRDLIAVERAARRARRGRRRRVTKPAARRAA